MFEFQCNLNGQQHSVGFDRFARIGSSAECEVRIPDAADAHALTVVNEGPKGLRVMIKSNGVIVNQEACTSGASLYIQPGAVIQVGSAVVTLAAVQVAQQPVAPPRVVAQHPSAAPLTTNTAPQPQPVSASGKVSNADMMAIIGIAVCVVLFAGGVWWTFFRTSDSTAEKEAAPQTIASMIEEIRKIEDWTVTGIEQDQVIAKLRDAYQLEARKRTGEARMVVDSLRTTLLRNVPTDENGHFVIDTDALRTKGPDTEGKNEAEKKVTSVSVTELWFEDEFERRLFAFLSHKSAALKP